MLMYKRSSYFKPFLSLNVRIVRIEHQYSNGLYVLGLRGTKTSLNVMTVYTPIFKRSFFVLGLRGTSL